jgi:O-acetyl-ADP-ribose deacetylase
VIHAVAPVWKGGGAGERALLEGAYRSALRLAREHDCKSIAFPAIGTGIYGYPLGEAPEIAVR